MKNLNLLILLSFLAFIGIGCSDNDPEEPGGGTGGGTDTKTFVSIPSILEKLNDADNFTYTDDVYVKGTITGNDVSGNIYKLLFIQDGDDAIRFAINTIGAASTYPLGSKVVVNMKDLTIGKNGSIPEIGAGVRTEGGVNRIDDAVFKTKFVLDGEGSVTPTKVTIADFKENPSNYLNKLLQFENVQFNDANQTYANPDKDRKSGENRTIIDCDGNTIILRNSDYAKFAGETVAGGNGTLTALGSSFRETAQLLIREVSDVDFTGDRCTTGGGGADATLVTIKSVLDKLGGDVVAFTADEMVEGTVISDDEPGNFFKTLVIQDATGGIALPINVSGLYKTYPRGSKVQVKLNGLAAGLYNNLPQIGAKTDKGVGRLTEEQMNASLINAGAGDAVTPKVVTIEEYNNNISMYVNTLVKLENVQFASDFAGKPYAEAKKNTNTTIEDCDSNTIVLRNSGYSKFYTENTPEGKGALVAVASVYKDTPQLFIRDTQDVDFTGDRCDGNTGGGDGGETTSIASLRTAFADGTTKATGTIKGIVTSTNSTGVVNSKNIIVQSDGAGIVVRFAANHSFNKGDVVEINVDGQELSEYRKLLQVNNVPLANAKSTGTADLPDAVKVTISEYLADHDKYESLRLMIENVTLSSADGTYNKAVTLNDGSSSVVSYIGNNVTYKGTSLPSDAKTVYCIGSEYNDPQVLILSLDDVQ